MKTVGQWLLGSTYPAMVLTTPGDWSVAQSSGVYFPESCCCLRPLV